MAQCITRAAPRPPVPPQDPADDGEAPKGHEFKQVRRQMAQMLTVLRERQVADGIDRKTALRLQKRASLAAGLGAR